MKSIPEQCYFNIVSFGSRYDAMFKKSQQANDTNINRAINRVKQYSANFGGT